MNGFEQGFNNIAKKAEQANPRNAGDYIGEDGLLYCCKCNTPKQISVPLFGEVSIRSTMCKCARDEKHEEEKLFAQQKRAERIEQNKKLAFPYGFKSNWIFVNDDNKNSENSRLARNYASSFDVKSSGWLVFFGSNGTGKSFLATCICNDLLERGFTVRFIRLAELEHKLFDSNSKSEIYESLVRCDLLVIDDLFAERDTSYMKEIAFNVTDSRYKSGKPAIITTNLSPKEFGEPADIDVKRVLDRVYENCIPIKMAGESRRKRNMIDNAEQRRKELLNYRK